MYNGIRATDLAADLIVRSLLREAGCSELRPADRQRPVLLSNNNPFVRSTSAYVELYGMNTHRCIRHRHTQWPGLIILRPGYKYLIKYKCPNVILTDVWPGSRWSLAYVMIAFPRQAPSLLLLRLTNLAVLACLEKNQTASCIDNGVRVYLCALAQPNYERKKLPEDS